MEPLLSENIVSVKIKNPKSLFQLLHSGWCGEDGCNLFHIHGNFFKADKVTQREQLSVMKNYTSPSLRMASTPSAMLEPVRQG